MNFLYFFLISILIDVSTGRPVYTTANAHSHNDYEQKVPFYDAWHHQFGSIEADIFLDHGRLIVAHDSSELARQRTLDSLYLSPLLECVTRHRGSVYADTHRSLQLMIDIKSGAEGTLTRLVETLKKYPTLTKTASLKILISGNRPVPAQFSAYPSWIFFDGELQKEYSENELKKIVMLSDDYSNYTGDPELLRKMIDKAHRLGKKVRFWNAPDHPESWQMFMKAGVDFINTDKITELSMFLSDSSATR